MLWQKFAELSSDMRMSMPLGTDVPVEWYETAFNIAAQSAVQTQQGADWYKARQGVSSKSTSCDPRKRHMLANTALSYSQGALPPNRVERNPFWPGYHVSDPRDPQGKQKVQVEGPAVTGAYYLGKQSFGALLGFFPTSESTSPVSTIAQKRCFGCSTEYWGGRCPLPVKKADHDFKTGFLFNKISMTCTREIYICLSSNCPAWHLGPLTPNALTALDVMQMPLSTYRQRVQTEIYKAFCSKTKGYAYERVDGEDASFQQYEDAALEVMQVFGRETAAATWEKTNNVTMKGRALNDETLRGNCM